MAQGAGISERPPLSHDKIALIKSYRMAKTISFINYQGGNGKTTSAVNTAAALAAMDKKPLLVDLEAQASATRFVGIDPEAITPSFYHVFRDKTPARVIIQSTDFGYNVLPSSDLMAGIEMLIEPRDKFLLKEILAPLQVEYDFILLDTPPGKAKLTNLSVLAADYLIIPAIASQMSIGAISDLVSHIQAQLWLKNPKDLANQHLAILFTNYLKNQRRCQDLVQAAKRVYNSNVLDVLIPQTDQFPRSAQSKQPLVTLSPDHPGSMAYRNLAEWIVDNVTQ